MISQIEPLAPAPHTQLVFADVLTKQQNALQLNGNASQVGRTKARLACSASRVGRTMPRHRADKVNRLKEDQLP